MANLETGTPWTVNTISESGSVTRDARGRITGFVLWAGRVRHLRFEREGR